MGWDEVIRDILSRNVIGALDNFLKQSTFVLLATVSTGK